MGSKSKAIRLPSHWRIENASTGDDYGEYPGDTAEQALDVMARRTGFPDFALWCEAQGVSPEDVTVTLQRRGVEWLVDADWPSV